MNNNEKQNIFDDGYYNYHCGIEYNRSEHWKKFFGDIAERIIKDFNPKTVLDVGCAKGFLVEALRDRGIEAYGIDISEYAISQVREDIQPYCKVQSILEPIDRQYDLILNIEVLEHLENKDIEFAIKNMCDHSEKIIFSSTPHDLKEATHFSVKPIEEWVEKFYNNNFIRDVEYDASFISNQAIFLQKSNVRIQQIIKSYERRFYRLFNENVELRKELIDTTIRFDDILKEVEPLKKTNSEYSKIYDETQKYIEYLKGIIEEEKTKNSELSNELSIHEKVECVLDNINNLMENNVNELSYIELEKKYEEVNNKCEEISKINSKLSEILNQKEEYVQHLLGIINLMENTKGWKALNKIRLIKHSLGKPKSSCKKIIKLNKKFYHNLKVYGIKNTINKTKQYLKNDGKNIYLNSENEFVYNSKQIENWKIEADRFEYNPLISIVVPVYNTPLNVLQEMVNSVIDQIYTNWELCIVNASIDNRELVNVLNTYKSNEKIKIIDLKENGGISNNTNYGIIKAKGEFIALLDHDDTITKNALFEVVKKLQDESDRYDFFYSDKDMMDEEGKKHFNSLYKPKWSPEIMYSANYLTHFCVIRKSIIEKVGYFDSETDGAQDWDMFIKVTEVTDKICHIPKILYNWRILSTSVASGIDAKPYALEAQLKTINNHLLREKINAKASFNNRELSIIKIDYTIPKDFKLSIIINDNGTNRELRQLIKTIVESNIKIEKEILVLSNKKSENNLELKNVRFIQCDSNDYWIAYQLGAEQCTGDTIIFIDSKIKIDKNIILELAQWTLNENIGIVGPKFLFKDNKINNIGIILNRDSILLAYRQALNPTYNIFGYTDWYRNFNAISYECFAISKKIYDQVKGYDGEYNCYAQIDLCKKIRQLGLRNMYNPFSKVISNNMLNNIMDSESDEYVKIISKYNVEDVDEYWNENLELVQEIPQQKVINNGSQIEEKKPGLWDMYSEDAKVLAEWFDFSTEELNKNNNLIYEANEIEIKSVNWFLPDFDYAFYAGLYTIFRYANYMNIEKKVKNNFIIVGDTDVKRIKKEICRAFPSLANSNVYSIPTQDLIKKIPYADASICSLWTTAYFLLKFNNTKKKFYFMQDYEPLFYPAGASYAQAETTYRFNFFGLTNTVGLSNIYRNEYQGKSEYLTPCVDSSIFYPEKKEQKEKYKVFFYGRPGHPRNGFELGTMALKKLKEKLGDKVQIVTAGADWKESEYGVDGVITNLGRLKYEETGDLYRSCDVGLILMFTKHPSYLPFELMACGTAVVSNYNPSTTWFLKNEENCILTDASATRIAEAIISILENKEKKEKIEQKAIKDMLDMHTNWNEQLEKLFNYMEKIKY